MDLIQDEGIRILELDRDHHEYSHPPRLVFKNPDPKEKQFTHLQSASLDSSPSLRYLTQQELGSVAASLVHVQGETREAALNVVKITSEGGKRRILHIDRAAFLNLVDSFVLARYGLYLYLTNTPGFHFLGLHDSTASEMDTPTFRFYVNTGDCTILWSYCPSRRATRAVLIGEADSVSSNQMLKIIHKTEDNKMAHPLYLPFLACSHGYLRAWECDANSKPRAGICPPPHVNTMELDHESREYLVQLSELCLWYGKCLNHSEGKLKILRTLQAITNDLDLTHTASLWGEIHHILLEDYPHSDRGGIQRATHDIQLAIPFLKRQIASRIAHLEARARSAEVNLRIGSARVHRTEARQAKRDSQTMVSIAFTTMVFLPATFVAALFDMQAATAAMKSDFELYWKIAVPVTAVVLLCWDLMTGGNIEKGVGRLSELRVGNSIRRAFGRLLGVVSPLVTAKMRLANWRQKKMPTGSSAEAPMQEA